MGYWIDDLNLIAHFIVIFFNGKLAETCGKWSFCRNVSNDFCGNMERNGVKWKYIERSKPKEYFKHIRGNVMWYEWNGWTAVSSITEIAIGVLTLLTIIIAFYQLVDDKKTKIGIFSFFDEGEYTLKYHDKIYKLHCNKKYLEVMNLQARKNSIRIVLRNKSSYPIEIFKYTVYARRNIVIHLFLCCMRKIFKIDYELCQKREFFIERRVKKISLTPNQTKIKYISLNEFEIPDILFYEKFAKIILSSMKVIIQIECYPKKIKKKLGFSIYKIEKEFKKTYNATVGISYYVNGDDSLK